MSEMITFNTEDAVREVKREEKSSIYPLVPETATCLTERVPEFDFNSGVDAVAIASTLVESVKHYKGYGLSANQCGLNYRVFVMGSGEEYVAFFNPEIIETSETSSHMVEGCLSFPGLSLYITRPNKIRVKYQDFNGEMKEATFEGLTARIFQHELDHLDGIVYTKRAKPMALKSGKTKREKFFKKVARDMVFKKLTSR